MNAINFGTLLIIFYVGETHVKMLEYKLKREFIMESKSGVHDF